MIYVNRCTDSDGGVVWVAGDLNEKTKRGRQLYLGLNVNEAIDAAVHAGMPRQEAVSMAQVAIGRRKPIDTIIDKPTNGLLVHQE